MKQTSWRLTFSSLLALLGMADICSTKIICTQVRFNNINSKTKRKCLTKIDDKELQN